MGTFDAFYEHNRIDSLALMVIFYINSNPNDFILPRNESIRTSDRRTTRDFNGRNELIKHS